MNKLDATSKSFRHSQSRYTQYLKENKRKATKAELAVMAFFYSTGIEHIFQKVFFLQDESHFRIVDFYIPKPFRTVVEVDGDYHEFTGKYDSYKDKELLARHKKMRIIRISNENALNEEYLARVFSGITSKLKHLERIKA